MRHAAQLLGQDVEPLRTGRRPHLHLSIKSAWSSQRVVKRIRAVSCSHHNYPCGCNIRTGAALLLAISVI